MFDEYKELKEDYEFKNKIHIEFNIQKQEITLRSLNE